MQILLQTMQEGTADHRRFIAGNNFACFCMYYFTSYFKRPNAPFHYEIMKALEDLSNNVFNELLLVGFRGCAKTTLAQFWYLWLIVFKKRHYINIDSYDGENSERTLYELADIMMTNKKLIQDFGYLYKRDRSKSSSTQNRVDNFTTTNGIRVEANTTQVDIRGRKHFENRPNVRALDDFETLVTKDSDVKTKSIRNNIMSGMGGLAPKGVVLYLGNYLTEHGNIQYIIDRAKIDKTIKVIIVPIMVNNFPTWPSRYALTDEEAKETGKESIETIQLKFGSYQFSYDFMCLPVDDNTSEFKKEFIQISSEHEVNQLNTLTYITIDSALSEKETADFTGITINRVSEQNKWYIKVYGQRMNSKDLIDHIFMLWDKYHPEYIGLEETTFTIAIKPFIDEEMRIRRKFISFKMLQHKQQNKVTRIRALIPRWESRSIFFVDDNLQLKEEMRSFPNGANDDCLDSLAYQLNIATPPPPVYGSVPTGYTKPIVNKAR